MVIKDNGNPTKSSREDLDGLQLDKQVSRSAARRESASVGLRRNFDKLLLEQPLTASLSGSSSESSSATHSASGSGIITVWSRN